ncbi:phage virion morphogenesis protein [Profundibacterium mesophilum]|uniref:Mu-like prophage FluMu G protein 2 n=1 Tax=Profundibacterium mesophilum KAUST100406-0324 TaxID=1037889 RepID=A0A921TC72_9RHOB|nr:phage virion morphogenesis protein [Profundibacterium mesophilum]KAF0676740.1 Mu-like prophage FluMu G protein 2 [Profundibacterium mesophilum KAUST100406-0324]
MRGLSFETEVLGLDPSLARIGDLRDIEIDDLAFEVGALIEDQAKLRIDEEKAAPDGTPWVAWSEAYDETRNHAVHSLLVDVGQPGLMSSIANVSRGPVARVGSNLPYAAVHQFGSEDEGGIPARPYLGTSAKGAAQILDLIGTRIEELLA